MYSQEILLSNVKVNIMKISYIATSMSKYMYYISILIKRYYFNPDRFPNTTYDANFVISLIGAPKQTVVPLGGSTRRETGTGHN